MAAPWSLSPQNALLVYNEAIGACPLSDVPVAD
jgi:hypothetical protein